MNFNRCFVFLFLIIFNFQINGSSAPAAVKFSNQSGFSKKTTGQALGNIYKKPEQKKVGEDSLISNQQNLTADHQALKKDFDAAQKEIENLKNSLALVSGNLNVKPLIAYQEEENLKLNEKIKVLIKEIKELRAKVIEKKEHIQKIFNRKNEKNDLKKEDNLDIKENSDVLANNAYLKSRYDVLLAEKDKLLHFLISAQEAYISLIETRLNTFQNNQPLHNQQKQPVINSVGAGGVANSIRKNLGAQNQQDKIQQNIPQVLQRKDAVIHEKDVIINQLKEQIKIHDEHLKDNPADKEIKDENEKLKALLANITEKLEENRSFLQEENKDLEQKIEEVKSKKWYQSVYDKVTGVLGFAWDVVGAIGSAAGSLLNLK